MEKINNLEERAKTVDHIFETETWPEFIKSKTAGAPDNMVKFIESQWNFVKAAFKKAAHREIGKRYGRSKYNPHQGSRECARRLKQASA